MRSLQSWCVGILSVLWSSSCLCSTHSAALKTANAFVSPSIIPSVSRQRSRRRENGATTRRPAASGDDLFESLKRLWGGGSSENTNNYNDDNLVPKPNQNSFLNFPFLKSERSDDAAGTTVLAAIPVRSIKPGGLRLFLMFYLMGMSNTPDPNSWKAHQPTMSTPNSSFDGENKEDYLVEVYYHDQTGMISIELEETEIRILRCGSVPSQSYLMQESVMLQGILDELQECATEFNDNQEPIAEADRLLIPEPLDAIEQCRQAISFG